MGPFGKIAVSVVGAIASYFAVKYTKKALEEKPLKARVDDVKGKVVDFKVDVQHRASDAKSKVDAKFDALSKKADALIKGQDEKPPPDDDNGRGVE
jgi:hypothetical protein